MRFVFLCAALCALSTPAFAAPGDPANRVSRHRHDAYAPRRTHGNGSRDCPNGDCRGLNSPGNIGGAPGDF